jgi:hypothetical protein
VKALQPDRNGNEQEDQTTTQNDVDLLLQMFLNQITDVTLTSNGVNYSLAQTEAAPTAQKSR